MLEKLNRMMYYDLNLPEKALLEKEKQLGFCEVFNPEVLFLNTPKDLKQLTDGIAVESKNSELLRTAAKKKVLVNPLLVKGFNKDDGLVRAVASGNAMFEIPVFYLVHADPVKRSELIKQLSIFTKKCVKLGARFCLTSRAITVFDLKNPHEMIAIGMTLGLTRDQAKAAISIWPEKWLKE